MSLACTHESLMQYLNLFVHRLFLCLQEISGSPFCRWHSDCRNAPCILELPQCSWLMDLWPVLLTGLSPFTPLSQFTVLITRGGACVVHTVSWVPPSRVTDDLARPLTISPAPYSPLWQSWERKAKSWQEEQCFSQKLVTHNWISSFISETPGEGG